MDPSRGGQGHLQGVIVSRPQPGLNVSKAQMCQKRNWSSSEAPKDEHWLCPDPLPAPDLHKGMGVLAVFKFQLH